MKKLVCLLLLLFILGINSTYAKPITASAAQKVAQNFYSQNARVKAQTLNLTYTETSAGLPVYYVFDINEGDGFVIVTADDVAHPIIGYATEGHFVLPEINSTIFSWLAKRKKEVNEIRAKNLLPTGEIAFEWIQYATNKKLINKSANKSASVALPDSILPLVQSTWNQSPGYNSKCPGRSVTGCVATAMAQIMRYWSYPIKGAGSSSYCDCTSQHFTNNYGTLSANYGTTTYNWANMPLNASSADAALLSYQCGVSVNMDYDPNGSGAYVCSLEGDPICAQHSYTTYFGYDPTTIQGLDRNDYPNDADWVLLLQTDLAAGRPVQYVGDDPNEGGHTWVCDGYDVNGNFHMNWGWGGADNAYFYINDLNSGNGTFSDGHEALIGIKPIATTTVDAGLPAVFSPSGVYCSNTINPVNPVVKLENYGSDVLTSCVINYQLDNGTVQTINWTGSLGSFSSVNVSLPSINPSIGTHSLTCFTSNPNGTTDNNAANDVAPSQVFGVFSSVPAHNTGISEGFESNVLQSADWSVSHTSTGVDWAITSAAAATGSKSIMIDNSANVAGNNSILETTSFDLGAFATPSLTFKMAYQNKASTNNDKLIVYVSVDCGATWISRWAHSSTTLPTVSGTSPSFVPTPSQFTTYTVTFTPTIASSHNAMFRWKFFADVNGPGNNLYVDDINIFDASGATPTVAGIQNIEAQTSNLSVYPNPAHDNLFIKSQQNIANVLVIDMLGKTVINQNAINDKNSQVDVSNLPSGVYFVKVTSGDSQKTIKFIKQ